MISEISAQISLLENVSVVSTEMEGTDVYENHGSWERETVLEIGV